MDCPACRKSLREVEQFGIRIDRCPCGGVWFDRGELEAWMTGRGRGSPGDAASRSDQTALQAGEPQVCPRCAVAGLQRFENGEVRGATCQRCHGIWLTAADVGRLQHLTTGSRAPADQDDGVAGGMIGVGIGESIVQLLAGILGSL